MVQIDQNGQRVAENLVGSLSLDVDDKPHPARIMLILRVIKALFRRQSGGRSPRVRFQTHRFTIAYLAYNLAIFYSIFAQAQYRSSKFFRHPKKMTRKSV
jgi:hypothetical protein